MTISNNGVLAPGCVAADGTTLGDALHLSKLTFTGTSDHAEFDTYGVEGPTNDRVFVTSLEVDAPVELVLRLHAGSGFGHVFDPGSGNGIDGEYIRLFVSSDPHIQFGPNGYFYTNGVPLQDGSEIDGFYVDQANQPTTAAYTFRFVVSDTDIRMVAVPEPNAALTLAASLGTMLGLSRLRRRRPTSPPRNPASP